MKKKFKARKITRGKVILTVAVLAVGLLIFQPRTGLFFLGLKIAEKSNVERAIDEAKVRMVLQQRKIDLLKNNENYIEKILRQETNMIKQNEKVMKR